MPHRKSNKESVRDLAPEHAARLLHRVVYRLVKSCIDRAELADIEERLAIEIGRIPDVTDEQMLTHSRLLVGGALRELADEWSTGACPDDQELVTRYLNAICAEVDPGPFGMKT